VLVGSQRRKRAGFAQQHVIAPVALRAGRWNVAVRTWARGWAKRACCARHHSRVRHMDRCTLHLHGSKKRLSYNARKAASAHLRLPVRACAAAAAAPASAASAAPAASTAPAISADSAAPAAPAGRAGRARRAGRRGGRAHGAVTACSSSWQESGRASARQPWMA